MSIHLQDTNQKPNVTEMKVAKMANIVTKEFHLENYHPYHQSWGLVKQRQPQLKIVHGTWNVMGFVALMVKFVAINTVHHIDSMYSMYLTNFYQVKCISVYVLDQNLGNVASCMRKIVFLVKSVQWMF